MRPLAYAFAVSLVLLAAAPAHALCSGSTVDREYRVADVVVRATVIAETRVHEDEPSPAWRARWGEYSPVLVHRLRVVRRFKGRPGPEIRMFQEVTSGSFHMDVGGDYLLFLTYYRPSRDRPPAARGAMYIRYACGQSKPWRRVAPVTSRASASCPGPDCGGKGPRSGAPAGRAGSVTR
ncbi:MAG TPA: hypothetical protein VF702_05710 [Allosphingosinicella sp.]|jgi:hypothetical protein